MNATVRQLWGSGVFSRGRKGRGAHPHPHIHTYSTSEATLLAFRKKKMGAAIQEIQQVCMPSKNLYLQRFANRRSSTDELVYTNDS